MELLGLLIYLDISSFKIIGFQIVVFFILLLLPMGGGFKHTPLEDILYFTRLGNSSDFFEKKEIPSSYPSQLAGLINASDKSLRNNPTSGDIVFLFGKIPLKKVKKEDRWGYPIRLDENNNVLERGKIPNYKNVFLTNYEPTTRLTIKNEASALQMKGIIDLLLNAKKFVNSFAKYGILFECVMDNLMFKNDDTFLEDFEEGVGWPDTGEMDPLVAGFMLGSSVQEPLFKDSQKYIYIITVAKEYYSIFQDKQDTEEFKTIIAILGDDYLKNIETTLQVLQDQVIIQENKEKMRISSVNTIEKQLGVTAKDINFKDEVKKLRGLRTGKNKLSDGAYSDKLLEGLHKLILATLADGSKEEDRK